VACDEIYINSSRPLPRVKAAILVNCSGRMVHLSPGTSDSSDDETRLMESTNMKKQSLAQLEGVFLTSWQSANSCLTENNQHVTNFCDAAVRAVTNWVRCSSTDDQTLPNDPETLTVAIADLEVRSSRTSISYTSLLFLEVRASSIVVKHTDNRQTCMHR
jgi:hypothetical protein